MDDNGHGTHCAGTIGAVGNNAVGVVGVNWNVRLMALKFLDSSGSGSTADAVAALDYAIDHGAHVTSNSWGGGGYSAAMKNMIDAAGAAGQLFVAAAGNDYGVNNDTSPHYPSSYSSANIIAVASSDHNDNMSSFSNYGPTSVDLAAPGSNILSTVPSSGYGTKSGTSMATPHVSGAVALLLSRNPGAPYQEVKGWLLDNVTPLPQWKTRVLSGGRLDVEAALVNAKTEFRIDNMPGLPFSIAPNESLVLDVVYEPTEVGSHAAVLRVASNDTAMPQVDVTLSGLGVEDYIGITPSDNFIASGYEGGPFAPESKTYTLHNDGTSNVHWTAESSETWAKVSSGAGYWEAGPPPRWLLVWTRIFRTW